MKQSFNSENAKMFVVCNVQAIQDAIYLKGLRHSFDELWALSIDELRELQDELIIQYNNKLNKLI
jgi:hypothetical protein